MPTNKYYCNKIYFKEKHDYIMQKQYPSEGIIEKNDTSTF